MDVQNNLRNFKDFLQLYNQMTENCFNRCVDNANSRKLDPNETECVDDCASKFIKFNHKLMSTFVETQSIIVNRRIKEAEEQNQSLETSAVEEHNPIQQELSIPVT